MKAKEIALHYKSEIENLSLSYRDDGLGYDTSTISIQKGLGLRNIESRVSLLNGEITYKSEESKGVEVEITL